MSVKGVVVHSKKFLYLEPDIGRHKYFYLKPPDIPISFFYSPSHLTIRIQM